MRQDTTTPSFARPEPFRVREEGHIVNRDGERDAECEGSGIGRSKKNVRLVGAHGPPKLGLFPPRAGASRYDASFGSLLRQGDVERVRRIENEPAGRRVITCSPAGNQLSKIASNARDFSEQLARIDADSQRLAHAPLRCFRAAAARYASYSASALASQLNCSARSAPLAESDRRR